MKTTISKIKDCTDCLLHQNQAPLLDTPDNTNVFWVGLSAVKVSDTNGSKPLSNETRSGKLIREIEEQLGGLPFYRTNLVKCFPESGGKIRYPNQTEMNCCFPNLATEVKKLSPKTVILLGKQVADYIFKAHNMKPVSLNNDFSYTSCKIDGVVCVPVHHPSYVLIYHRRNLDKYVSEIRNIILDSCSESGLQNPNFRSRSTASITGLQ